MASLGGPSVLVPMICTYRAYLSSMDTDPFSRDYEVVLEMYLIDSMNTAAAQTPASVSQQIYAASRQVEPTAFLLWNTTPGLANDREPGLVSLLHPVSHYASRMGRPAIKWYNRTFENRVDVSYSTAPMAVWDPNYLHLALAVYVPSAATIDTSLAGDPNGTLLGTYVAGDVGAKIIRCR